MVLGMSGSGRNSPSPDLVREVGELCDALMQHFDEHVSAIKVPAGLAQFLVIPPILPISEKQLADKSQAAIIDWRHTVTHGLLSASLRILRSNHLPYANFYRTQPIHALQFQGVDESLWIYAINHLRNLRLIQMQTECTWLFTADAFDAANRIIGIEEATMQRSADALRASLQRVVDRSLLTVREDGSRSTLSTVLGVLTTANERVEESIETSLRNSLVLSSLYSARELWPNEPLLSPVPQEILDEVSFATIVHKSPIEIQQWVEQLRRKKSASTT